jgi:5-methylcytosine-specific restriction endonuclease McrA
MLLTWAALGLLGYGAFRAISDAAARRIPWDDLRQLVFERDDFTCIYCGYRGTRRTLHADHRIPVSRRGSDALSNLGTACWSCNLQKGAMTEWEFRLSRIF